MSPTSHRNAFCKESYTPQLFTLAPTERLFPLHNRKTVWLKEALAYGLAYNWNQATRCRDQVVDSVLDDYSWMSQSKFHYKFSSYANFVRCIQLEPSAVE